MRIKKIKARNFLSFDSNGIELCNFGSLNTFVGPNNAGKTNLFRIITLIGDTLKFTWPYRTFPYSDYLSYYHNQNLNEPFEIELSLEFGVREKEALVDCLVCSQFMDQVNNLPSFPPNTPLPNIEPFRRFVLDSFGQDYFKTLFDGDLSIVLTGTTSESYAPKVWFKIKVGAGEVYVHDFGMFTTALETPRGFVTISAAQRIMEDIVRKYPAFSDYIKGTTSERPALGDGYPPPGLLDAFFGPQESGSGQTPIGFNTNRWSGNQMEGAYSNTKAYQRLRAFYRSKGVKFSMSTVGFFDTFRLIFLSSIVTVSDVRLMNETSELEHQEAEEFPLYDMSYNNLADVLFRFKNNELLSQRRRVTEISKAFSDLTGGRTFDLILRTTSEKTRNPPELIFFPKEQQSSIGADAETKDNLMAVRSGVKDRLVHELSIQIGKDELNFPIELSAAGIAEALLLSASIGSTGDSVIILDEPAQKMHPNLQNRFLELVRESARINNNQFFMITHSPYLVSAEDERLIWRFVLEDDATSVENIGETILRLGAFDQAKIEASFRNAEIRALLFSKGVVLVEGPSDKIVIEKLDSVLAERQESADLSSKEWSIIAVGSKNSFPTFFKLCRALGLPRLAIADSDALLRIERMGADVTEKVGRTSAVMLALFQTDELSLDEKQTILDNSNSILSDDKGSYYDAVLFAPLQDIAHRHRVFILKKDLENAVGIDVTKKASKPIKAMNEMVSQIEQGSISEELRSLAQFIKIEVSELS